VLQSQRQHQQKKQTREGFQQQLQTQRRRPQSASGYGRNHHNVSNWSYSGNRSRNHCAPLKYIQNYQPMQRQAQAQQQEQPEQQEGTEVQGKSTNQTAQEKHEANLKRHKEQQQLIKSGNTASMLVDLALAEVEVDAIRGDSYGTASTNMKDDFQVVRVLDSGAFASVHLAWAKKEIRAGGCLKLLKKLDKVAIKSYSKAQVIKDAASGAKRHMEQECALVGKAVTNHPHILGPLMRYDTAQEVHLVMELASGGSLHEYVRKHNGHLREHRVRPLMQQITSALAHLHAHGLCHRDLKLENCVITGHRQINSSDGKMEGTQKVPVVKLIDFGLAASAESNICSTLCGSPQYMAPELVHRMQVQQSGKVNHDSSGGMYSGMPVDCWALGVLMYTLMTGGKYPFSSSTLDGIWNNIKRGTFMMPQQFGSEARNVINSLLKVDSNSRISVAQVQRSPFMVRN